jgi:hypothetical protein
MKPEKSMAGEDSELAGTCSELVGTHFTIGKINSDENSGVQKVRNWNNRVIPRNFERNSQPKLMMHISSKPITKFSNTYPKVFPDILHFPRLISRSSS